MKLATVEECTAFLDDLRVRGARGVKLSLAPDGAVTGVELAFAPPRMETPPPRPREPKDNQDERQPPRARIPAGLGYGVV